MSDVIKKPEAPLEQVFIWYESDNGKIRLRSLISDESVWLSQIQMSQLFDTTKQNIGSHIKNIIEESEVSKATVKKFFIVQDEGNRRVERLVEHYSLDMIIAVGYRVNSKRATQFRHWATRILKEFIIKGFVLDDDRLKQGERVFEKDYFRELLERIRSIRASERRIYQQITDIFAECCVDYNPQSDITHNFYAMIQNKFHYAITGHTAAEIIYEKSDKNQPAMGLLTWKNSPDGRILSSDVKVAKNSYIPIRYN